MSENEEEYLRLPIHHSACTPIFEKVQDCERDNPIGRIFGKCSEFHVAFTKCMKQNKLNLQAENNERARLRRQQYRAQSAAQKDEDI